MNRYSFLLVAALLTLPVFAILADDDEKMVKYRGGRQYMFRLSLADKQGTPFSIDKPEAFLSGRALERRNRQGCRIDSTDLPVSHAYLEQIAAMGVGVVSKSKWNNTVLVRTKDGNMHKKLAGLPFVREVRKVWMSPDSVKPSSRRENLRDGTGVIEGEYSNIYGAAEEQIDMLNGIRLHDAGYRGKGMMIAVMDGGFMNADRIPSVQEADIVGSKDFVVPESPSIYRETSHGTIVLSTMAVNIPHIFVGTAPEASYLLLRSEDTQTESLAEEDYWTAAAEYADSCGVDVINSSLGYHYFDNKADNYKYSAQDGQTAMISRTASMLAGKGIVLVSSAGNDGMGTWKKINFPSDARDILTVGAVSANRENAAFSGIGPTIDGRIKPDVMALGSPTTVITERGVVSKNIGTSFSTPLVCGLVACLWQALRDKTAYEIIELVRQSGDNHDTPDNICGYGIPDFWRAYRDSKAF